MCTVKHTLQGTQAGNRFCRESSAGITPAGQIAPLADILPLRLLFPLLLLLVVLFLLLLLLVRLLLQLVACRRTAAVVAQHAPRHTQVGGTLAAAQARASYAVLDVQRHGPGALTERPAHNIGVRILRREFQTPFCGGVGNSSPWTCVRCAAGRGVILSVPGFRNCLFSIFQVDFPRLSGLGGCQEQAER